MSLDLEALWSTKPWSLSYDKLQLSSEGSSSSSSENDKSVGTESRFFFSIKYI